MTDQNQKQTLVFISAFLRSAKKVAKEAEVRISTYEIKKNPCCDQYSIIVKNRIVWQGFAYNSDEALGDYIFQQINSWNQSIVGYDGLELSPVAEYADFGSSYCERVEDPGEAQFWSLYGHLRKGGVECIEDFNTEAEGLSAAKHLLALYQNLREHGLLR